jgi:hypothetical protein
MKMKALLLGTATAFVVGGAAQAADLAIAVEPVDYVKVCDAFGVGFYYIPGTDTCLRIRGDARLQVIVADKDFVASDGDDIETLDQNWEMSSEANVDFTGNTMSDVGLVQTYLKIRLIGHNYGSTEVIAEKAYGVIGPASFGLMANAARILGGSNYSGDKYLATDGNTVSFLLSYMMGTWGIFAGVQNPHYLGTLATGDLPDFVLKLTGGAGGVTFGVSGLVSDRTYGTGWMITAALGFDLGGGSSLKVSGSYADDLGVATGGTDAAGTTWSVMATGALALGNMKLRATASYIDDGAAADTGWEGAIGPEWALTSTSKFGLDFFYKDPPGGTSLYGVQSRISTNFAGGT